MKDNFKYWLINGYAMRVFNQFLYFNSNRDIDTILNNPLIQILDKGIKKRVESSILSPNEDMLDFHDKTMKSVIFEEVIDNIIHLYNKIIKKTELKKVLLVSVLRSGLILSLLLKHLFLLDKRDVEVVGISPNYINYSEVGEFKDFIEKSEKDIVFIDGWSSEGVTYNIIKIFWSELFNNKTFWYGVLSNLTSITDRNIIYSTNQDIMIPWSICQTDYTGLSNFFINPITKKSCSFYIPDCNKRINNLDYYFKKLDERKNKVKNTHNNFSSLSFNKEYNIKRKYRFEKIGINECIKSIEKKDTVKILIGKDFNKLDLKLWKKYLNTLSVKYEYIEGSYCYVIKSITQ